jgi:hypothetical protein
MCEVGGASQRLFNQFQWLKKCIRRMAKMANNPPASQATTVPFHATMAAANKTATMRTNTINIFQVLKPSASDSALRTLNSALAAVPAPKGVLCGLDDAAAGAFRRCRRKRRKGLKGRKGSAASWWSGYGASAKLLVSVERRTIVQQAVLLAEVISAVLAWRVRPAGRGSCARASRPLLENLVPSGEVAGRAGNWSP